MRVPKLQRTLQRRLVERAQLRGSISSPETIPPVPSSTPRNGHFVSAMPASRTTMFNSGLRNA